MRATCHHHSPMNRVPATGKTFDVEWLNGITNFSASIRYATMSWDELERNVEAISAILNSQHAILVSVKECACNRIHILNIEFHGRSWCSSSTLIAVESPEEIEKCGKFQRKKRREKTDGFCKIAITSSLPPMSLTLTELSQKLRILKFWKWNLNWGYESRESWNAIQIGFRVSGEEKNGVDRSQ